MQSRQEYLVKIYKRKEPRDRKVSNFVQHRGIITDFSYIGKDSWVILSDIERSIKAKIEAVGTPLKNWDIQINYGIKTGFNDAFIITTEKRDEILSNCSSEEERQRTAELIRPILRGRDIKRYNYDWAGLWLINTHNGIRGIKERIQIEDYPAVKAHLDQFWDKISTRSDKGDTPYNLRNCVYVDDFKKPKIMWKRIGSILRFSYDSMGFFGLDSTCFAVSEYAAYLCCVLNSNMGHYLLSESPKTGTGDLLISVQAVEPLKIPKIKLEDNVIYEQLMNDYSNNENAINQLIYSLYNLSSSEINFIESQ